MAKFIVTLDNQHINHELTQLHAVLVQTTQQESKLGVSYRLLYYRFFHYLFKRLESDDRVVFEAVDLNDVWQIHSVAIQRTFESLVATILPHLEEVLFSMSCDLSVVVDLNALDGIDARVQRVVVTTEQWGVTYGSAIH